MALIQKSGPLTAALVRSAKEPGKYHDGKGTGLYLRVETNGSRFWVQRATIKGKRREIGLGSPPIVSLVAAREEAEENKRMIRHGDDPLAQKRKVLRQKLSKRLHSKRILSYPPRGKTTRIVPRFSVQCRPIFSRALVRCHCLR